MSFSRTRLRVAAIGDLHVSRHSQGAFQPLFAQITGSADVLVICGDFTDYGLPDEARILARELTTAVKIPVIAVLGNHDYEAGSQHEIWSKSMIMERERYDGGDVAHLLRHCSGLLNWDRLVRRFGTHWRILLAHLVLFGFIYPGERALIPSGVIRELVKRLLAELDVPTRGSKVC